VKKSPGFVDRTRQMTQFRSLAFQLGIHFIIRKWVVNKSPEKQRPVCRQGSVFRLCAIQFNPIGAPLKEHPLALI
jgi:hypothetical protein